MYMYIRIYIYKIYMSVIFGESCFVHFSKEKCCMRRRWQLLLLPLTVPQLRVACFCYCLCCCFGFCCQFQLQFQSQSQAQTQSRLLIIKVRVRVKVCLKSSRLDMKLGAVPSRLAERPEPELESEPQPQLEAEPKPLCQLALSISDKWSI